MHVFFLLVIMAFIHPRNCIPQEHEIEKLLEGDAEYSDQSDLMDRLLEFEKNPINVNRATEETLLLLPWITPYLAKKIIAFRSENGPFRNIDELLYVPEMTMEVYDAVEGYLSVGRVLSAEDFDVQFRTRMTRKLEKSMGYRNGAYDDSPYKLYQQLRVSFRQQYTAGAVFEKDSGEKDWRDLTLYYLLYEDQQKKNRFIIGNYRLELGQGLTFWNPYSYGKGSATVSSALKRERGLLPYTMVDENSSLFGVASQFCLKIYQLFIFYSDIQRDASLNSLGTINNLYTSGYHRNTTERNKKDIVGERLIGTRLTASPKPFIRIGVTASRCVFDTPFENVDIERNRFSFRGAKNEIIAADANFKHNNINVFTEIAQSKSKGWGAILGTNYSSRVLNLLLLMRNYEKNFHSLHGSGFSDMGGRPQNERGFYTGLNYSVFRHLKLHMYFDIYKYPWRSYFENMPTAGSDLLLQIEQKIDRNLLFLLMVRHKRQDKLISDNDLFGRSSSSFATERRTNIRFQIDYLAVSNLKLRMRLEKIRYEFDMKNSGLLLFQDVNYKIKNKLNIYFRLTFFDTDSYQSRLFQFENDLPYVMTNQMLYGAGNRWYVCLTYRLSSFLRMSFKYGVNQYENIDTIGTGDDMIEGDSYHLMSFQMESNL